MPATSCRRRWPTAAAGRAPELLEVANKLLGHLLATFSLEDGDGRLVGVCGHPEVETALVEFYRLTGDDRALRLAERQVSLRGRKDVALPTSGLLGDRRFPLSYFLHHVPVRERVLATGHAVRELYLQAGVVDVAVEAHDEGLLGASEAIWDDLFATKTYITGAHGSRHRDESIGDAYELPSDRAYAETCAAIASFQWNWRLLLATGRAHADAMERVFWNTIAGSVSRLGTEFFYSNTLHLRTGHDGTDEDSPRSRLAWYECACCPPNLARLMASIQAYLVTKDSSGLQLHMPFTGTVSTTGPAGPVELQCAATTPGGGPPTHDKALPAAAPRALWVRRPDGQPRAGAVDTKRRPHRHPRPWALYKAGEALGHGRHLRSACRYLYGRCGHTGGWTPSGVAPPLNGARWCTASRRTIWRKAPRWRTWPWTGRALAPADDVPARLKGYVQAVVHAPGQHPGPRGGPLYEDRAAGTTSLGGPTAPSPGPHLGAVLCPRQPAFPRHARSGTPPSGWTTRLRPPESARKRGIRWQLSLVTSNGSRSTRAAKILQVEAWGPQCPGTVDLGHRHNRDAGERVGAPAASHPVVEVSEGRARLRNGDLVVDVAANPGGGFLQFPPLVSFSRADDGQELLSEQSPHFTSPPQRRYTQGAGSTYRCEVTFNPSPGERIYGLGQHQHGLLDQKGAVIDLIQRNTEV